MKLKIIKREYKEVETNLELPVFLYFQDELCNDELVKITEKHFNETYSEALKHLSDAVS